MLPFLYPSCRNCSSCSWSSVRELVWPGRTPVCWMNCCRLHCLSSLFNSSSSSCLAWEEKNMNQGRKYKATNLQVKGNGCSIWKYYDLLSIDVHLIGDIILHDNSSLHLWIYFSCFNHKGAADSKGLFSSPWLRLLPTGSPLDSFRCNESSNHHKCHKTFSDSIRFKQPEENL